MALAFCSPSSACSAFTSAPAPAPGSSPARSTERPSVTSSCLRLIQLRALPAMGYRWNFAPVLENADVLAAGALGTLRLFAICAVTGLSLGLVVGLMRHARSRWAYVPATAFVEFFRNTP